MRVMPESDREQLKHGVTGCNRAKAFGRCGGTHGKESLYRGLVAIQIELQYFWFLGIGDWAQPVIALRASPFEDDLAGRFTIAHPLGPAAGGHEVRFAAELKHIHGRRVNASGFSSAHLQELHVRRSDPESNQKAKNPIENDR